MKLSETVMKRLETVMNIEFSGTLGGLKRSYILYNINGLKFFTPQYEINNEINNF